MEAVQAVGPLVKFVRLFVIGPGLSHKSTAAAAADIVVVKAVLAQWGVSGACVVTLPDPLAAIAAEQGVVVQALGAQLLAIEMVQLPGWQRSAAEFAGMQFFHGNSSLKRKKAPGLSPRPS